ncbi:hypothetical protein ACJIZ3_012282 [Penstemon smallii]|uniref:Transmembrane protein n=1 Tax=Penstemon smallii TaxID=265156 RepID=A0ABD3ULX4_9LAMI
MARYYNSSYHDYLQYFSLPIPFFFFLAILFLFLILTWFINYEYMFEDAIDHFKLCLMVFPVILLLFLHWFSNDGRERVPFSLSKPEKDSLYRVGGSPLGVAILLVFLMFMISHHSSLHERWDF